MTARRTPEQLEAARVASEQAAARLAEAQVRLVEAIVAAAPPLTERNRRKLAVLFGAPASAGEVSR